MFHYALSVAECDMALPWAEPAASDSSYSGEKKLWDVVVFGNGVCRCTVGSVF
jgi:hypothetical protein